MRLGGVWAKVEEVDLFRRLELAGGLGGEDLRVFPSGVFKRGTTGRSQFAGASLLSTSLAHDWHSFLDGRIR